MFIVKCSLFIVIYGGIAQLGEHLPCKQGVKSSNLFISTNSNYIRVIHRFASQGPENFENCIGK